MILTRTYEDSLVLIFQEDEMNSNYSPNSWTRSKFLNTRIIVRKIFLRKFFITEISFTRGVLFIRLSCSELGKIADSMDKRNFIALVSPIEIGGAEAFENASIFKRKILTTNLADTQQFPELLQKRGSFKFSCHLFIR